MSKLVDETETLQIQIGIKASQSQAIRGGELKEEQRIRRALMDNLVNRGEMTKPTNVSPAASPPSDITVLLPNIDEAEKLAAANPASQALSILDSTRADVLERMDDPLTTLLNVAQPSRIQPAAAAAVLATDNQMSTWNFVFSEEQVLSQLGASRGAFSIVLPWRTLFTAQVASWTGTGVPHVVYTPAPSFSVLLDVLFRLGTRFGMVEPSSSAVTQLEDGHTLSDYNIHADLAPISSLHCAPLRVSYNFGHL
ncbi:hypothetical protein BDZ89DRAFT_1131434 [Hymenopellis radicata]|nr:hypothetical protein BDZ89DRAFT_1131434 [Hymenopellis radicata]